MCHCNRPSGYSSPPPLGHTAATPARQYNDGSPPGGAERGLPTPVPVATPAFVPPPPPVVHMRADEDVERAWAEGWALLNHRKTEKQARAGSKPAMIHRSLVPLMLADRRPVTVGFLYHRTPGAFVGDCRDRSEATKRCRWLGPCSMGNCTGLSTSG